MHVCVKLDHFSPSFLFLSLACLQSQAQLTLTMRRQDLVVNGSCSCAEPKDRDLARVTAEVADVLLHPAEGEGLVLQPEVPRDHFVLGGKESWKGR